MPLVSAVSAFFDLLVFVLLLLFAADPFADFFVFFAFALEFLPLLALLVAVGFFVSLAAGASGAGASAAFLSLVFGAAASDASVTTCVSAVVSSDSSSCCSSFGSVSSCSCSCSSCSSCGSSSSAFFSAFALPPLRFAGLLAAALLLHALLLDALLFALAALAFAALDFAVGDALAFGFVVLAFGLAGLVGSFFFEGRPFGLGFFPKFLFYSSGEMLEVLCKAFGLGADAFTGKLLESSFVGTALAKAAKFSAFFLFTIACPGVLFSVWFFSSSFCSWPVGFSVSFGTLVERAKGLGTSSGMLGGELFTAYMHNTAQPTIPYVYHTTWFRAHKSASACIQAEPNI